jgi:ankyrin repeat protein
LHFACQSGNLELVRYLIEEREADSKATTNNGQSILHLACKSVQTSFNLVKYLIETLGFNAETKDCRGNTSLHCLCKQYWSWYNDSEGMAIAKMLIESGAKVDDENADGEIPLGLVDVQHSTASSFFQWLLAETKLVFGEKWYARLG